MADSRTRSWLQQVMAYAGQPDALDELGNRLAEFFIDNDWGAGDPNELTQEEINEVAPHISIAELTNIYFFIQAFAAFLDSDLTAAQIDAGAGSGDSWKKKLNLVRLPSTQFRELI